jgi:anti-sigma factor RsiW
MTCELYEERLSALVDNELPEGEAESLFRHLSACLDCRQSLRRALELRSDLKEEVPPMAPKELDERVLQVVSNAKRYSGNRRAMPILRWKRRISLPLPVAAALSVILVAAGVTLSMLWSRPGNAPSETQIQTVYVTTLPAMEVQGRYLPPKRTIQ